MIARTGDGRAFRILTILDEYTRECLAILVDRTIGSQDVIDQVFQLFVFRGIPEHIRSDNGSEFTARAIRKWLNSLGVREYNQVRPHSSLGYRPPAPIAIMPVIMPMGLTQKVV
jgi:transposase InsO family protein